MPSQTYANLDVRLHAAADTARAFLATEWGYALAKLRVEAALHSTVPLTPTFAIAANDGSFIYADLTPDGFPAHFTSTALQCTTDGLPVKLYAVVCTDDGLGTISSDHITQARRAGTGIAVISAGTGRIILRARMLSLAAARHPVASAFPPAWRPTIASIRAKYEDGEAADALKSASDEIEALTRFVAVAASGKAAWYASRKASAAKYTASSHGPWKSVIEDLRQFLNPKKLGTPALTSTLWSRVDVAREVRNGVGHKPRSFAQRVERDKRLRTGYEACLDLLKDFLEAIKPLRPRP